MSGRKGLSRRSAQGMEVKARLKRIDLQVGNHFGEAVFEVGMLFEEFARVALKLLRLGLLDE